MFPSTTRLIPELQLYFARFITNSEANRSQVLAPCGDFDPALFYPNRSFIRLLFDETWSSYDTTTSGFYTYLYKTIGRTNYPYIVRSRLMVHARTAAYYVTDLGSECVLNLFNIQDDDIILLDRLLEYRNDATCYIGDIVYEDLPTTLSKLIYIYLECMTLGIYSKYTSDNPISMPDDLLGMCYELYVADSIFRYISDLGS